MEEYVAAAERVVRSGRYINGPETHALEHELTHVLGARYCVGVSTGLDALRLILRGWMELGMLRAGDEVVVPANTFIATFLAVTDCGLTAVAADVDETTACLDLSRLPLSPLTRVVVAVHLYGRPCLTPVESERLKSQGLLVLEDAAQAIGAVSDGRKVGTLGDAAAVSFYPAKNIGAFGDAGAVATDSHQLAKTVRMMANYGSVEKYRHEICGLNCRLDELQAALLRVKLPTLEEVTSRRRETAALYDRLITNPEVTRPGLSEGTVWHQYVIRHQRRDNLREHLKANGIGTEIHYPIPCHLQRCYAGHPLLKLPPGGLPVAERLAREILSLPIADVTPGEAAEVARLINEFSPS